MDEILIKTPHSQAKVYFNHAWSGSRFLTTCTIMVTDDTGFHQVLSGSAVCAPSDPLNKDYGCRLAFKRAVADGIRRYPERSKANERATMHAWRKALWEAQNPQGWQIAVEIPAEVIA